eukprot:TRINITY_DN690_c0_g2_i3.p1 TRINITY_DN690_c0_g2~~TRINITY_DN690_c0_g2_i3.p1  ORF type:complete len:397 (+),score=102.96 TRINITY_DN690_c0_g2_i3:68-1192(+)
MMKFVTVLLSLMVAAEAKQRHSTCGPKDGPGVSGSKVCLGHTLYAEFTDAQSTCSVLALVTRNSPSGFSYSYDYKRLGQPKTCAGSANCYGTAKDCNEVSSLFAPAVVFYIDPNEFSEGNYQLRMYTYTSGPDATSDIEIVDCSTNAPPTPSPTPIPTPVPTPIPTPIPTNAPGPDYKCVEANPPLTYTKVDTVEMMDGWSDCKYNLKHLPKEWTVPEAFTCKGTNSVPEGTSYTLSCPANSPYPCDWFVTHYHCPPCSSNENGGWPGILTTEGWESGSCGPRIATPFQHQTATYRRQLAPGESVVMGPSVKPTRYLTFHMMPGADCESMSAGDCDTGAYCSVINGKCASNWCPRRHIPKPGPDPCLQCIENCE